MSNSHRRPSIDASYHVSVHLAKLLQSRRFLEIDQSETRITCGGHVCYGSGQNEQSLQRTFHRCFLPSFGSFGKAVSEEKIFRNRPIRNKNCLWQPYLLMDRDEMSNFIEDLPQIHPTKKSANQKLPVAAIFVNGSGRNEQSLQRTFHRCFLPSCISFGQAVSEEKIFRNRPIRNKNCLWWPCLLMDWNELSTVYRGPPIDASFQVSVHLAEGFQRRRLKCEKFTDDGCQKLTLPLTR